MTLEMDIYLDCMKSFIGKTLADVSYGKSSGEMYVRWTFTDGGYQEWHTSLKHVTYHPLKSEDILK